MPVLDSPETDQAFVPPPLDSAQSEPPSLDSEFVPPPLNSARPLGQWEIRDTGFGGNRVIPGTSPGLSPLTDAAAKVEGVIGDSIRTVLNEGVNVVQAWSDVLHPVKLLTGQPTPQIKRYEKGDPIIPPVVGKTVGQIAEVLGRELTGDPQAELVGTDVPLKPNAFAQGLGKSIEKNFNALSDPDQVWMLPFLEAKVGRAAMAGVMAYHTPEQIRQTVKVLQDPNSTRAQKWEALADSGINLAMQAALIKNLKPAEIMAAYTPEEAYGLLNQSVKKTDLPTVPIDFSGPQPKENVTAPLAEAAKAIEMVAPLTAEAVKQTAEVKTTTTEEVPNASSISQAAEIHGDVQPQPDPSQGEVPVAQGEQGVQPQASGGIQEVPAQPSAGPSEGVKEMIGMGGAVPSEFEGEHSVVSNMFAVIDQSRKEMGLEPMPDTKKRTWDEDNQKALARMNKDPNWIPDLVKEVTENPRPLLSWENAGIVWQRAKWRSEFDNALGRIAKSFEDGRTDDLAEARLDAARYEDKIQELDTAVGRNGTGSEAGRTLQAQKMGAGDDFSLIEMRLRKRASANEGAPLNEAQEAEIQKLHDDIQASQKALDKHRSDEEAARDDMAKQEANRVVDEVMKEEAKEPRIHPAILAKAEEIVRGFERRADAARLRWKERMSRVSSGVDPLIIKDVAEMGLGYLTRGALELGKWSAEMLGEFGDSVKPYLEEAFAEAKRMVEEGSAKAKPEVQKAVKRSQDVGEQIMATGEAIEKKVAAGKKNEISGQVQKLARLFVKMGVKGREDLIGKVHDVLKRVLPEITRRETMDAISGYGDFKQLSRDQISVQLRGMKGEMQQIAKLEDMAKGEPPAKSGVERRTPTEAERQLVKLVNKAKFEFQVPITDPATQLKSALDTYKTTLRNRIKDLQAKIDAGDYSKPERRALQLDPEALRLKAENERLKQKFRLGIAKDKLKARNWWQKTMDTVVKWRRGFILSGPVTLAKLTAAAVARMVITPIEEGVGAGISKLIPSVADKARREGGASLKAETQAITEGFTRGMQDAWKTLKTGQSDLDLVFGKGEHLPQSFIDIFGNVHGALKAPVKRAEFARSFQKRAESYAREGVDVTDEFVQTKIGMEAYQDAQKAIFMQKNIINDAYKRALTRFDQINKETGRPSAAGATIATTARVLLPIVKVPTNIVGETMQYAIGSVTGSARLGLAFKRGIENLKPEEADLIMRHLKKGSLGAAAVLTGYLAPQVFGGFYQQGQKRKKDDIAPDAARINGVDVPSYYIHNPFVTAAQVGATVRRVSDSKLRKRDSETQGLSHGAMAAALGLADATPFIREMTEIEKLMNPYERDQWTAEMARSMLVPQALQSLANQLDKDQYGDPVKRKAVGPLQGIQKGVPGLREELPRQK